MKPVLLSLLFCMYLSLNALEYHVAKTGSDQNPGTMSAPFKSISQAARIAREGDIVTVHEGTYREKVSPAWGGKSDLERIVYRAAPGEEVIIKGSEIIKNWQEAGEGVWKAVIDNAFFGDYNPYQDTIKGDWFWAKERIHHTGEVYLNGQSFFEVPSLDMVRNPEPVESARDKEASLYQWYCESDEETTTIWANFHDYDPTREQVEISVRNYCFYPEVPGRNYITVKGFHMSQAATQWAPPTSEQVGLLGTHWSKGWIIEDNTISYSKCVGITLGKDRNTGQNHWMHYKVLGGATSYNEVILMALQQGWSKEKIGSHVVRNNTIYGCEQAGIVGSLGGIFSEISNNHIYDIWTKRMFTGAEMGGIKIHGSIDMLIKNNRIHNTGRGIWIDWMAQGTRITGNLLYDNTTDDLFSEVNHGPYLVDNNLLLSEVALSDWSEGGAFVHNLMLGKIKFGQVLGRFTPYHLPHSTQMAGFKNIYGGDNRFVNNIIVKGPYDIKNPEKEFFGLGAYEQARYPMMARGNVYYAGAEPGKSDSNVVYKPAFNPDVSIEEKDNHIFLTITLEEDMTAMDNQVVTTKMLGTTVISRAVFEQPDERPYFLDTDFSGSSRNAQDPTPGPFEHVKKGKNRFQVW